MIKNILLRRKGAIGDVLMLTPISKRLHSMGWRVYVKTDCGEVFKQNPYVSAAGPHNLKPHGGRFSRTVNLDLAYEKRPQTHIIDAYSKIVFGDENTAHELQMYPSLPDLLSLTDKLNRYKINPSGACILHMGVGWENRTFPPAFWISLLGELLMKFEFIICVGKGNDLSGHALIEKPNHTKIINLVGKLTIHELYHLINISKIFIGPDSAPLHIAQCTDKPCIGLYTCAKPDYRATSKYHHAVVPKENDEKTTLACFGCLHDAIPPVTYIGCRRGDFICVKGALTPKMVLDKINSIPLQETICTNTF